MSILKRYLKITDLTIFVIVFIFFSTLKAQNLSKLDSADNISDYFSGILLLNDGKYIESNRYLKKLNGLEKSHSNYSSKYLFSLINSGKFMQAYTYSKKLEQFYNINRHEAYNLSPYDETLLIDADYLIGNNLNSF